MLQEQRSHSLQIVSDSSKQIYRYRHRLINSQVSCHPLHILHKPKSKSIISHSSPTQILKSAFSMPLSKDCNISLRRLLKKIGDIVKSKWPRCLERLVWGEVCHLRVWKLKLTPIIPNQAKELSPKQRRRC